MEFLGCISQSHRNFADDGNINTNLDPTDLTDANTFEELAHNFDLLPAVIRDQANLDQLPDVPPGPEEPANQTEASDLEMAPIVVIDKFPHSSTGAPIPEMGCA